MTYSTPIIFDDIITGKIEPAKYFSLPYQTFILGSLNMNDELERKNKKKISKSI